MSDAEFDIRRDACFVGLGSSPLCYYRVLLPAMTLGADWCGVSGKPPELHWSTGQIKDEKGRPQSVMPDLSKYKVVVLQHVSGRKWVEAIKALQDQGIKVVYEIDDYVHGIKHMQGEHDYIKQFDDGYLRKVEECMRAADAIITSTEWIATNYARFNETIYVCRNGIDPRRYELGRAKHDTINIGWAGGTGHKKVVIPWFQQAAQVMRMRDHTCFISIGQNFALAFEKWFGPERAIAVPWASIEQYPAAMTMMDIALAPAGNGSFFRGKSDLRWLEAGALGIPCIANPRVYGEIEDGVTGFKANSPPEVAEHLLRLVDDPVERVKIGSQAREFVLENRTIEHMALHWEQALREIVEGGS